MSAEYMRTRKHSNPLDASPSEWRGRLPFLQSAWRDPVDLSPSKWHGRPPSSCSPRRG
ncbi:MAG: hypothetical protein GY696_18790 [Gammaproteobacteria bacterium]|nr:hypothetical protein [Gammaproteobacteria bacterium]